MKRGWRSSKLCTPEPPSTSGAISGVFSARHRRAGALRPCRLLCPVKHTTSAPIPDAENAHAPAACAASRTNSVPACGGGGHTLDVVHIAGHVGGMRDHDQAGADKRPLIGFPVKRAIGQDGGDARTWQPRSSRARG